MAWYWFILFLMYGACVGSFLNVVVYRLPEEKSLIHPPSACPKCGQRLKAWHNVPVLAWFYLRGKCANCKSPISFQYPAVEALTGIFFAGLYWIYYATDFVPQFANAGLGQTWPVFVLHLILVASLLAATLIDAKLYIIPIQIPWFVTALAMIALPIIAFILPVGTMRVAYLTSTDRLMVDLGLSSLLIPLGGAVGLLIACTLLYFRVIPQSFADAYEWEVRRVEEWRAEMTAKAEAQRAEDESESPAEVVDYSTAEPPADVFLGYPHARREILKEMLFVLFPIAGMVIGYVLRHHLPGNGPLWAQVLAGSVYGYLAGGGIVWLTRILGTWGFRKEAMGLGDVHLMAAVGAVLGPIDPVVAFFIAPFFGLGAVLIAFGISRMVKGSLRIIPYGPYLAGATVVVMVFRTYLPG